MNGIETKSMDRPDELRTREKTTMSVVHLGWATLGRLTLEPGWRWSECIRTAADPEESCQAEHIGYVVSGTLHVASTDGSEGDLRAGEGYHLAPGHDAWVLGDAPFLALEFESTTADTYATS
jgi:hypothetical protein